MKHLITLLIMVLPLLVSGQDSSVKKIDSPYISPDSTLRSGIDWGHVIGGGNGLITATTGEFHFLNPKSYTLLIAVCDMCTAITINAKMENGAYWRYRREGWLLWHWTRKEQVFTGRLKKAYILYVQSNY